MTRTLQDFVGCHSGETAWLFGKGPTLDKFEMSDAGPLRCAVNDAVRYVPQVKYCFACDGVAPWVDLYQPGHILFQPIRTIRDPKMANPGSWPCQLVEFDDIADRRLAGRTVDSLVSGGLAIRRGTIGSAIQVLHVMGVSKIVCIGIDGGGSRASRDWRTGLRPDAMHDYNAIRDSFISAAAVLGIELEFFGSDPEQKRADDRVNVIILSACIAGGTAAVEGDVMALQHAEAWQLIHMGRAEPYRNFPAYKPAA